MPLTHILLAVSIFLSSGGLGGGFGGGLGGGLGGGAGGGGGHIYIISKAGAGGGGQGGQGGFGGGFGGRFIATQQCYSVGKQHVLEKNNISSSKT